MEERRVIVTIHIDTESTDKFKRNPGLELSWVMDALSEAIFDNKSVVKPGYSEVLADSADDICGWMNIKE